MFNQLKLVYLFIALLFVSTSNAQLLINGANVISNPNAEMIIVTDSLIIEENGNFQQNGLLIIDRDAIINDGLLNNDGRIEINENVLNNDSLIGQTTNALFFVRGNWTNNALFNAGQSRVTLDGTVQEIRGSQISRFYNLVTIGNLADVKRLVAIDAEVTNTFDLTDVEFATDNQTLLISNPNPVSISRNTGFVSSLGIGRLERATNSTNTYLFPTGSTLGVTRYRPIEITPNSANSTVYGVRLANVDATTEGFDIMQLNDSLCAVNPNFYHRIYGNQSADIKMFYIPTDDGEWNAMAHWQNVPEWQKMPNETSANGVTFEEIETPGWNDYSQPAFALGISRPSVDLGPTQEIDLGNIATLMANYNGPTPQQIIWTPIDLVNCFNCFETDAEPTENTTFNIEISVSERCIINDSVLVIVNPGSLHLPTAFSPNNDGANDIFSPLNENLSEYQISIWNRWGELVYLSDDFRDGWDGIYKGEPAPLGVYSYNVEYKFEGRNDLLTKTGNVTLLR